MKMTYMTAIYNIQSVFFSNEQDSMQVTEECFVWNLAVLGGEIYLLYPGGQAEVALLRESPFDA